MTQEASKPRKGTYIESLRDLFDEHFNGKLLGFSLYWAWLLSSAILFDLGTISGGLLNGLPLSVGTYIARGLGLVVVVFLARRRTMKQIVKLAEKVGALAGPASFALLMIAMVSSEPLKLGLLLGSWALMGIADGLLVVAWLCIYRSTSLHSAIFAFFGSMILAVGLMVLVGYVTAPVNGILVLLMPLGCALGLRQVDGLLAGSSVAETPSGEGTVLGSSKLTESSTLAKSSESSDSRTAFVASGTPKSLRRLYGAIVVFGVVFGGMQAIIFNYNHAAIPFTLRCLGICFGSVLALLLSVLPESARSVIIYRFALPLMACGLLLVPLTGDNLFVSTVLVNTGFFLFDFISICMLIRATVLCGLAAPPVMAWGRCANAFGILVGWIVGHVLATTFSFGLADISAWSSILLLALIMACGSLLSTTDVEAEIPTGVAKGANSTTSANEELPNGQQVQSGRWSRQCDLIVSKYGLSPRESEVLKMLSRGRDAEYIATVFVISPHTAKTHIHNVYKKLDIHSQQDLISMVEDAARGLVNEG